jgi:hypothetical protein
MKIDRHRPHALAERGFAVSGLPALLLFLFAFSGTWISSASLAPVETRCSLWLEFSEDGSSIIPNCVGSCSDAPVPAEPCTLHHIGTVVYYCICGDNPLNEPPWCRGAYYPATGVKCLPADNCPNTCFKNEPLLNAAWQACTCAGG